MWGTHAAVRYMNLQLKELPPIHRNDKVQLEHILTGVSKKYHAAYRTDNRPTPISLEPIPGSQQSPDVCGFVTKPEEDYPFGAQ